MKTDLIRVSMLVLGAAAAGAQNPNPLVADVPFDFNVKGVAMPAGGYVVAQHAIQGFITLRGEDSKSIVILTAPAEAVSAPATGRLVFRRYGDRYFLAETWTPGSNFGRA